jgi:predicted lipoprotein with Yx(FWY)xxD motif
MNRSKPITFLAPAGIVLLAAVVVAVFGSGSGSSASAATAPPQVTNAATATVRVANSRLGKILVDSRGRTLYLFKKDKAGTTKSACFGQCATFWPPLRTTAKPTVGSGLSRSKVGTIARSDGKRQVTYNGHPLYRFKMDTKAGDTNGENVLAFGARWFAVSSAGKQVSPAAAPQPPTSGGGGGY